MFIKEKKKAEVVWEFL